MAERLMIEQKIMPPGDTNPLGDRWIGTSLPSTGIHGTIDIMSIGKTSSHGCIRLYPADIHELFNIIKTEDIGEIIYEPVKVGLIGHRILLEAHRDVYRLVPEIKKEIKQKLEALGLADAPDDTEVSKIIDECRGIPIIIGSTAGENEKD
jgi:L,D-transpeptidase ErfK/SrfK